MSNAAVFLKHYTELSHEDAKTVYDALGAAMFLVREEMKKADLEDLDQMAEKLVAYRQVRAKLVDRSEAE